MGSKPLRLRALYLQPKFIYQQLLTQGRLYKDPASAPCHGEFELNPEASARDANVANRTELAGWET